MRHRKNNRRLGRKPSHRRATLRGLATALLVRESIRTTKFKAKEAQSFIDSLITIAKNNTPESKRRVFSLLRDKGLINLLFNDVAPRFKTRNSGYTRIIPLYPRRGDGSPMAILELVEKKPKVTPKKPKKEAEKKKIKEAEEKVKKEEKKPEAKPKIEEKEEPKVAPAPKADVKEEKREEKARDEQKKIKKTGFFKQLRRYFRGKAT